MSETKHVCGWCNGIGKELTKVVDGNRLIPKVLKCALCGGTGETTHVYEANRRTHTERGE